jgi:hypothetical protein
LIFKLDADMLVRMPAITLADLPGRLVPSPPRWMSSANVGHC